MNELKRCPFCGSEAEVYPDGDMEGYSIMCSGSGALFGGTTDDCPLRTFGYASHQASVEAWNRRADRGGSTVSEGVPGGCGIEEMHPFWCHEQSHDRPRCAVQCAECADAAGVTDAGKTTDAKK